MNEQKNSAVFLRPRFKLTIDESYELYSKAIGVGLIWPTGSVFNKTEIWTKDDLNKWMKINPQIREIFEHEKKIE